MPKAWDDYLEKNKDRFLNEMLDLLRIPSVSAKSEHKDDMHKCAGLVKQRLVEAGQVKVKKFEFLGITGPRSRFILCNIASAFVVWCPELSGL